MQTATIFAPPSSIQACPTKHTCPHRRTCAIDGSHTSGTLAIEKRTSDVPACHHVSQRTCWSQPALSWDSRNAATQSVRTGTACRLPWSRTLTGMSTTADELLAHWNTRLFHWNTCANPSVPDQMCTQRPESHNAHIFSVICDGRKILEHWNTHFRQSSSGLPDGPALKVTEGVWRRYLWWHLSLSPV